MSSATAFSRSSPERSGRDVSPARRVSAPAGETSRNIPGAYPRGRRRFSAARNAPPPVAITRSGTDTASRIAFRSLSRNACSPSVEKISGIRLPVSASIRSSTSTNSAPRRLATSFPTELFPAPMNPTRTAPRGVPCPLIGIRSGAGSPNNYSESRSSSPPRISPGRRTPGRWPPSPRRPPSTPEPRIRRFAHRAQGIRLGGNRLHHRPHNHGLAARHPPLDPPRPVRFPVERKGQPAEKTVVPALPREDLVVHGLAGKRGQGEAPSDLDPLDGRYAHQGLRQPPVDPFVPGDVRTETGRNPAGDDLHRPPDRPSRLPRPVDHRGRSPGGDGIGHPQIAFLRRHGQVPAPRGFAGGAHLSDRDDVSRDLHTHFPQHHPREGPCRNPGRRLPGARPLQDVADVPVAVFEYAPEIGVSGACRRQRGNPSALPLLGHLLPPVLPVPVAQEHGHRASERPAEPDPGENLHLVLLDLHPLPATVPDLPAGKLTVYGGTDERHPGRQSLDDGDQGGAVGLPGRAEREQGRFPSF